MAEVLLKAVRKEFGGSVILRDVDLTVASGEFLVLVGPSGCGKSTLLRQIAGLDEPTSGDIRIDGRSVVGVSPKDRGVAMVFQNYALYPHMTVRENMAFGLTLARMPRAEIDARTREAAAMLDLDAHLDKRPAQLSGGQRQRVAMGRAMMRHPRVFLFDEPLSNLDAQLRVRMRAEISRLHRRLKSTVVYVTHDQVEAMTLADRVAVLRGGKVEQVGPPLEVYKNPRTRFVASFLGSPPMNFLPADGGLELGVRPEDARLTDGPGRVRLGSGETTLVEPLGAAAHVHVQIGAADFVVETRADQAPALDSQVEIFADPRSLLYFDRDGGRVERAAA